jgi:hypothetical protein
MGNLTKVINNFPVNNHVSQQLPGKGMGIKTKQWWNNLL